MPNGLMLRAKHASSERNTTFRALVIDALEKALAPSPKAFRLRDASVGSAPAGHAGVSSEAINQAINAQREDPHLLP